jgi:N-acetyl-anhydromuramyl-L-alanine amidase AmpD
MELQESFEPPVEAHAWRYVVLHHSASERGSVAALDAEHRRRKDQFRTAWLGIGYHFVIGNGAGMADGHIEATFRWHEQTFGAHSRSRRHNLHGVGICLIGNFDEFLPTPRQMTATEQLCQWLMDRFAIDKKNVVRHRDVAPTRCPGRLFPYEPLLEFLHAAPVVVAGKAQPTF